MIDTTAIPVRFGYLKAIGKSRAHCLAAMQRDSKATSAMERGTAVHHILFNTCRVLAYPGAKRAGKEWEAFEAEHDGCHIVTKKEYEEASNMAEAIRRNPMAAELIRDAVVERTVMFDIDGRACRATPDAIVHGSHIIDVKTGETSDPRDFGYKARKYCYHGQLEWYQRATAVPNAYVIAVEGDFPFPVTVFRFSEATRSRAEALIESRWEKLRRCELEGRWPQYAEHIVDLDVPDDFVTEV